MPDEIIDTTEKLEIVSDSKNDMEKVIQVTVMTPSIESFTMRDLLDKKLNLQYQKDQLDQQMSDIDDRIQKCKEQFNLKISE